MFRIIILAFAAFLLYATLNGDSAGTKKETETEVIHHAMGKTVDNLFDFN